LIDKDDAMAEYRLPQTDIARLRELARRQAEIAALPVMQARKRRWTDMNDGKPGARPPFAIEPGTFNRDFLPPDLFQCETAFGKTLEHLFLTNIRIHEILGDDHVCPGAIDIPMQVQTDQFGIEIKVERAEDAEGVPIGYHVEHPIKNLAEDGFDMIGPSTFSVDREGTLAAKAYLEETFGDILPVRVFCNAPSRTTLTSQMMRLMSMESFFMAMYDCPDRVHALMGLLRDNAVRGARWAEEEGLLTLNNRNQTTCGTCYNWTTLLPGPGHVPGQVRLRDLWVAMDSQEAVGISPELFGEFCFPYYRDVAALFGLVYWGCCEPADPLWESSLRHLPNLKAVSISRWANERVMAEALEGTGIVYSRKPDPNFLSVDVELNEEGWRREIRTTLEHVTRHNLSAELIVRDVYTVHDNLGKATRAAAIACEEIDRIWGSEA
jgi:hypothetical protein